MLLVIGLIIIGIVLTSPIIEVWVPKSIVLDEGYLSTIVFKHKKLLVYDFTVPPQKYRNLSIELWIDSRFSVDVVLVGGNISLYLQDITKYKARIPVTPLVLQKRIKFEIINRLSCNVSFHTLFKE